MASKIQIKRGTYGSWKISTEVLGPGELFYVKKSGNETLDASVAYNTLLIGDGSTQLKNLQPIFAKKDSVIPSTSGTWTPVPVSGTVQVDGKGYYYKVGEIVFIWGVFPGYTGNSTAPRFSGLPFTVTSATDDYWFPIFVSGAQESPGFIGNILTNSNITFGNLSNSGAVATRKFSGWYKTDSQ